MREGGVPVARLVVFASSHCSDLHSFVCPPPLVVSYVHSSDPLATSAHVPSPSHLSLSSSLSPPHLSVDTLLETCSLSQTFRPPHPRSPYCASESRAEGEKRKKGGGHSRLNEIACLLANLPHSRLFQLSLLTDQLFLLKLLLELLQDPLEIFPKANALIFSSHLKPLLMDEMRL
jgi:hypothetical protein